MHKYMSPHGDYDHMGDTLNVIENIKVRKLYLIVENIMI